MEKRADTQERKIQILCLAIQTSSNGNGSDAICLVRWAALFQMCFVLKLEINTVKFRK